MVSMIETEGLTKLYGLVMGVNDITISLQPGVYGLLGPNGAGKSTFMKLLTGQLRATSGKVKIFGEEVWNNQALFRRIGYCPEQDAFYSYMTGLEFVVLLCRLHKIPHFEALRKSEEAIELVGMEEYMHRKIQTYSRGMRQRIKLAQAMAHSPELLILDEPLSATDPIGRHKIIETIKRLGKNGTSILVSSHILHEIELMTDNFILIQNGRVLAYGNVHEIRELMNEYPHKISIKCDNRKRLAECMFANLPVSGIELNEETGSLDVLTFQPREFYSGLSDVVKNSGVIINEFYSKDDNIEAVFNYLMRKR